MMKELKEMMNEGGTPVFTVYAVEIGDALWSALYDYLVAAHPHEENEWSSKYRIEGIYEEGDQKFAILRDNSNGNYFRMNFSISEEGYSFGEELIAVEKEFVPVTEEPQFALDAYDAYVAEYAESKKKPEENPEDKKCPECGKLLDECECEKEGKKDKYVLEEIPEYMELSENYTELKDKYSVLEASNATLIEEKAALENTNSELQAQLNSLSQFKLEVEREQKKSMISETFYMLPEEATSEILENIDTYSLEEIESKLSVYCVRNKISFAKEGEDPETDPLNYNLGSLNDSDDSVPAWIKVALEKQKNM